MSESDFWALLAALAREHARSLAAMRGADAAREEQRLFDDNNDTSTTPSTQAGARAAADAHLLSVYVWPWVPTTGLTRASATTPPTIASTTASIQASAPRRPSFCEMMEGSAFLAFVQQLAAAHAENKRELAAMRADAAPHLHDGFNSRVRRQASDEHFHNGVNANFHIKRRRRRRKHHDGVNSGSRKQAAGDHLHNGVDANFHIKRRRAHRNN